MSIKYTRTTLQKIEQLFGELNYKVRYEKGSFQSGYCIVKSRNIVVVNRFFDVKARINVLLDIISQVELETTSLSPNSLSLLTDCGLAMFAEQAA